MRKRGFNVVHSLAVGHGDITDEQHLRWAASQRRTIITFDRLDFERLAVSWFRRGEDHAGIILSLAPPRLSVTTFHRRLLKYLDRVTADEMANQLRGLDEQWF